MLAMYLGSSNLCSSRVGVYCRTIEVEATTTTFPFCLHFSRLKIRYRTD